ncbi:hypothetical protein G7D34_003701 [Salmonella enterica]|nr:hypothetical protein [Salmonella enterica]
MLLHSETFCNIAHNVIDHFLATERKALFIMGIKESAFETCVLRYVLDKTYLTYIPQYKVYSKIHGLKKVDFYIPSIKLAIEFDENYHTGFDQIRADRRREEVVKTILHCEFIRFSEHEPRALTIMRLESFLRSKGVKFSGDHDESKELRRKIQNCLERMETHPDHYQVFSKRLASYENRLRAILN